MDRATVHQPPRAAPATAWDALPSIDLRQLGRMTDDTGVLQHAVHGLPDPNHGYCIDDNARALIAAVLHARLRGYDERIVPLHRYLSFLMHAFNEETGAFRNFMAYDRRWLEDTGSQDSQGRAIWALGVTAHMAPDENLRAPALSLLRRALPSVAHLTYPRSLAFALLGIDAMLSAVPDDAPAANLRWQLGQRILEIFEANADEQWPWFEDVATYDNAKLPHALIVCGNALGRRDMVGAGLRSLRWLLDVQTVRTDRGDHLSIIGNRGWMRRDGTRARFDQQPLEAHALVGACLAAAEATGDGAWEQEANKCFRWFVGANDLGLTLISDETGGCRDGLEAAGVNANQGAESMLAYLLSVLELHGFRAARTGRVRAVMPATLGLGIVGSGKFASFCHEQYAQLKGLRPVAVWSRTAERARQFGQQRKLRVRGTLEELLHDPAVQVVHVATTPARHAEHALAALEAGRHVLCENPLAVDVVDAQRIIQSAGQRDLRLGVNFMMRYGPAAGPFKRIIASGVLGEPLRGQIVNRAGDAGLPVGSWFWDRRQSGGIFVEHAVHHFDLLRFWLGEGTVAGAMQVRRPGTDIVDQALCEVRYGPQTTVGFYHGFHQASRLDRQDIRLIFERGEAILSGWISNDIVIEALLAEAEVDRITGELPDASVQTLRRFEGKDRLVARRGRSQTVDRHVRLTWSSSLEKQALYGSAVRGLMKDFLTSVQNPEHAPLVSAEDGRAALEIAVEAARLAGD